MELEAWELSAMRDPRTGFAAAAVVVGSAAGTGGRDPAGTQTGPSTVRRPASARCATAPRARSRHQPRDPQAARRPLSLPSGPRRPDRRAGCGTLSVPRMALLPPPNRETGFFCSNCGRPICPMHDDARPSACAARLLETAHEDGPDAQYQHGSQVTYALIRSTDSFLAEARAA